MIPNEDRVFLEPIPPDEKTKTGIIIPNEAQKVVLWKVHSIGPENGICKECGAKRPQKLEVGMRVLINENVGTDIEIDGKAIRVIRHGDIHGYE